MGDTEKSQCRAQLSKSISDKLDLISKLRSDLELRKKSIGNSVDEQIVIAEMEYRLVKEEMALLNLQEQHWEAAALWDVAPHTPDIQKEVCEVLHSYILSVKEKGSIPALHASEHLTPENSILISSQGDKPSIPKVEWAHHSTDLQIGDRLLEVNGRLVIGKDSSEVNKILSSSRPVCRIVFLRPLSVYQMLKSNGCKETSNLRHELTSVVSRLNHKMVENSRLVEQNLQLHNDCDDLRIHNRKLKLQVLSLQSILLYLYQALEKTNHQTNWDSMQSMLLTECPTVFEMLGKISLDENCSILCSNSLKDVLSVKKKSIPCLELSPKTDSQGPKSPKPLEAVMHDNADNR